MSFIFTQFWSQSFTPQSPLNPLCKCKWRFVNSPQQHHHYQQHNHHQLRHQHNNQHHCLCPFHFSSEHNESTGSMGFALLFTAHFSSVLRQGHTHTHTPAYTRTHRASASNNSLRFLCVCAFATVHQFI